MTILQNITFLMFFTAAIIVYNKQLIRNCWGIWHYCSAVVKSPVMPLIWITTSSATAVLNMPS